MRNYKPVYINMLSANLAEIKRCVDGIKSIEDVCDIIRRYTDELPKSGSLEDNKELLRKTIAGIMKQINQWR